MRQIRACRATSPVQTRDGPVSPLDPAIVGRRYVVDGTTGTTALATTSEKEVRQVTKQVKQLDRVIIRFAGDSGDGMQLTGTGSPRSRRSFGNDLVDAAQLPRRDPGPPGHAAGRLVVPGALRRPRHPHARATRPTCWSR